MKFINICLLSILNAYLVFSLPANNNDTSSVEIINEEPTEDPINDYEIEHLNTIDEHLGECTVLLRKNGAFPLSSEEKEIYLYGNGIRKTVKGGLGSGDISIRSFENIETVFNKNGFKVLTSDYLDAYDECYDKAYKEYIKKLQSEFDYDNGYGYVINHFSVVMNEPECDLPVEEKGDVAIYVLSRNSGEGIDRNVEKGDVYLTDTERKTILTLARGFKKFLLVLNTSGPVDLSGLNEVKNILVLSQLGGNTSKTLVDLVTGKKYPSGKLATTWAKYDDYFANFGNVTDTDYVEGVYVGYRYFDSADVKVLFPFGYGLGYTDFSIKYNRVGLIGDKVRVDATVKNIGKYNGKEVLELYLSKPSTKYLDEPYQELVNFAKTKELKPGKKDNLTLEFKLSDFASYDSKSQSYILQAGSYIVRIGNSSRNTVPCAVIEVPSKIIVKKVKNQLTNPGFEDKIFHSKKRDNLRRVKRFRLHMNSIKTEVVDYEKPFEIDETIKSLTDEEKVKFVIGAHSPEPYGSYVYSVPGASGEFYKFGDLKPVVLSDGPAGLGISRDYYLDEDGNPQSTKGVFGQSTLDIIPDDARPALEFLFPHVPEGVKLLHQYTTAIPIATAQAQTWNVEFAKKIGDIIGSEMTIFNINLWLAPALNIHRSILNGRNFEYYSEDPYISGIMATYVAKGVQSHKNRDVTLKHYVANNKETNRSFNSSNMSERAFREIYLKGYEMIIKNTNPGAIMSSYNLINGVHVNHHKGVIANVLRKELNYNNIVMTDWLFGNMSANDPVHKYPEYVPYEIIKSSVDVIMPGSKDFYDNVLEAVKENKLSMEDLEASATRIYNLIKKIQN
ncbi:beta-glucosidase-related glycosidase [Anaeromyces robustus]|uniref:beta-glucosidase n=1 Tax=Anaeromyces robustus TaxID=1754192 RepID=A0A1Y1WNL0_9FUNG|nr:beta-glucosidase-related glycosidase [Anaeromyces robustus]|eukprot:ORX75147.1 beta-glucosidase-related glycosidase [Anaeromyces robustus]